MAYSPDTNQSDPQKIGHTVTEISEKASLLVREEIELAKAEVQQKVRSLTKGAAVAAAAGVFAVFGLIFALHTLAWFIFYLFFDDVFWGYLITTVILFVLAAIAGLIGVRWIKKGAPPTPDMAIDEAKRIRDTVSSS